MNDHRSPFLKLAILAFFATPLIGASLANRDYEVSHYTELIFRLDAPIRHGKRAPKAKTAARGAKTDVGKTCGDRSTCLRGR